MAATVPTREFSSVAEMQTHYAAVRSRCFDRAPLVKIVNELTPPESTDLESALDVVTTLLVWSQPVVIEREIIRVLPQEDGQLSAHACGRLVALICDTTISKLRGESRSAEIVKARQIGYFVLHHHLRMSMPQIGRFFGGRDHTSALHGAKRVKAVIASVGIALTDDVRETVCALWDAEWPRTSK